MFPEGRVSKAIRAAAGVEIGDHVRVVVERDTEERTLDVPEDLAAALEAVGLTERFEQMAFTHRKEYARWVGDAKRPATRAMRVAKTAAMIAEGKRFS